MVGPLPANVPPKSRWKLRELGIVSSRITFADLGVGTTSVGFNVETTLRNIPLSLAMADAANELQQQQIPGNLRHGPGNYSKRCGNPGDAVTLGMPGETGSLQPQLFR